MVVPSAIPSTLLARAKVNLYLHVTGRRADGYHLLDSLVVFAETGDLLRVDPAAALSLSIDGPFAAGLRDMPDNLVLRAAEGLRPLMNVRAGARLTLTKNLPVASGIGGGSADAAAALLLLKAYWTQTGGCVEPDSSMLAALALKLGADVPVCLHGRPCFMGGIGEEITPAIIPSGGHLLLVNPGLPTATPAIFKMRQGPFSAPARWDQATGERLRDASDLATLLAERRNDLTVPAIVAVPMIADVLEAIAALDGVLLARLSGSGATCFGLFADAEKAAAGAAKIRMRKPSWWVVPAPIGR